MTGPQQAVILCGGLGTRLRPYTDALPKPMIPVNGRPFLEVLIEQLREQGIARIVLLTGYRGQQIRHHFGSGEKFDVQISYSEGPVEWETGRRLWEARSLLDSQFMLNYSDNFVPFSRAKLLAFHRGHNRLLSLLLSRKSNGNIRAAGDGLEAYDPKREAAGLEFVEIGYMVVERDAVLRLIEPIDISFSIVLQRLVAQANLAGLICMDSYHSISDPERWKCTERYRALKRILLVDRDGTINVRPARGEYIHSFSQLQFVPGAVEGMRELSEQGFSFVVITNQAGIARGLTSREEVDALNSDLGHYLQTYGVDIVGFYVCPHHWEDGCDCRKPAAGLFFAASRDHLLRLDRTMYVGDDPRDCVAAANANCCCVYVGDTAELGTLAATDAPIHVAQNIRAAASFIAMRFAAWEGPAARSRQSRFEPA